MSYALIDNSSLTGVQRLLGRIETRGRGAVDGDIVALENLLHAILFYNEVVCIDDYKAQYRLSRAQEFAFVRFIKPGDFGLSTIEGLATSEAEKFEPEIRGGRFADEDFQQFFELLEMNIICTWDISSSVYFLTMKMLGQPDGEEFQKYSAISASLFTELNDRSNRGGVWNEKVSLVDSKGNPIGDDYLVPGAKWGDGKTGGLTPGLKAFVAALNWLTSRTIYYSLVARYLCADTFLHPIRSAFQLHYMKKTGVFGYDFTRALLKSFDERAAQTLTSIVTGEHHLGIKIDLPLFSAWLLREGGSVNHVIASALAIRDREEFAEARYQINQIREAVETDDLKAANSKAGKIAINLEKALQSIRSKYGLQSSSTVPVSPVIRAFNTFGNLKALPKLPEINARIPIPDFISEALTQKGLAQIYRSVIRDISSIWKLGDVRTKLAAEVRFSEERTYSPKIEDPNYRKTHSQWKSPM